MSKTNILSSNLHRIRTNLADIIVIAIIIIMSIAFMQLTIHKHNVYNSYAWDLGTYGQILRSTLEGKFMYHTPHLYVLPNGNYLFWHFTPILLSLLPIYAIFPYATTLLIIKPLITFSAAYPLYLLSKKLTNNNLISILIVLVFILYPLLHGALWFDFQHAVFLPLFIFLVKYAYISNRKILYVVSLSLLSLTAEQGALIALLMITIHLIYKYMIRLINKFKIFKNYTINYNINNFRKMFIFLAFIPIFIYFVFVTLFLEYVQREFTIEETRSFMKATSSFSILGYDGSATFLPFYVVTHISDAYNALTYDYIVKIIFIILVFGTLLFLPLQSIYGIIAFVFIIPFIFSNGLIYYSIGGHYPYYYIGFVFLGLIDFISRMNNNMDKIKILISILLISSLILVSMAPWSQLSIIFIEKGMAWYPIVFDSPDQRMLSLDKLVKIANDEDLPLLVQNHVFTHTTLKSHVYVLPVYELYQANKFYFNEYIDNLINKVDLVLLDLSADPLARDVYTSSRMKGFGVYAEGYNTVLLKRNYTLAPILDNKECINMIPHNSAYNYDGIVGLPRGKKGFLVYGPYKYMREGSYTVTFELKANDVDTFGAIAFVDVSSDAGSRQYARKIISGYELANKWNSITLLFNIIEPVKDGIEFRVYSLGNTNLEFKNCKIERVDEYGRGSGEIGVLAEELLFNVGFKSNYTVTLPKGIKTDTFWYGPKLKMVSGVYYAEIYLKIEPKPTSKVIDIFITDDNQRIVYSTGLDNNLVALGNNWYVARIPFVLNKDVNDLEIIGKNPNSNYEITISHINIQVI